MLKPFRKIRNSQYVSTALLIAVFICAKMCTSRQDGDESGPIRDGYGKAFAGSAACMSCHGDLYKSHIQTAHYRDSRPASAGTIKGSFDSGRNRFVFNSSTEVVMEKKGGGFFFQTAVMNGKEYKSEPFEIVIGSGKKGSRPIFTLETTGNYFSCPSLILRLRTAGAIVRAITPTQSGLTGRSPRIASSAMARMPDRGRMPFI